MVQVEGLDYDPGGTVRVLTFFLGAFVAFLILVIPGGIFIASIALKLWADKARRAQEKEAGNNA